MTLKIFIPTIAQDPYHKKLRAHRKGDKQKDKQMLPNPLLPLGI